MISEGGDLETAAVARIEEIDLDLAHTVERSFRIDEQDPLTACTEIAEHMMLRRGRWEVRVSAGTELTATRDHFRLRAWLTADQGKERVFSREWDERIARDLV